MATLILLKKRNIPSKKHGVPLHFTPTLRPFTPAKTRIY
ncbi:hypothetical protein BN137_3677 [Cronobacter condimenti 1330]|uniref:Uncharacterized protein n=1 Tax=Cronobacter condimenti 1330 TaxID=1073999 RepID=K8AEQ5_9ENTR|nr:hypothetical protein BN137_3677 [Cronobacter condimenti 1330]